MDKTLSTSYFRNIYFYIQFYFAHVVIFISYFIIVFSEFLYFHILNPYCKINDSFLDFGSFLLTNISLGFNYQEGISCYLDNNRLSYRPNRFWHEGSYSCLFGTLMWYKDEVITKNVQKFFDFLIQMSYNKHTYINRNVWLLIGLNTSSNTRISFINDQRVERDPRYPGLFSTLDDGYELFWLKGVNQRIPILFTIIKQRWFDNEFLNKTHITPDGKAAFKVTYAAGTNFICWAQANFRIFDYFDFWGKSDFDLQYNDTESLVKGELIPLNKMAKNKIIMFGCNHNVEIGSTVSQNLFQMAFEHFQKVDKKCGRKKHLKIRSISKGFLFSQQQKIPGFFQIGWLGLFSSAEVKSFTDSWFYYDKGIKIWRWGDQQYTLLVSALFEKYPEKTIGIWPNERVCLPYSNKTGDPIAYLNRGKGDLKFIKKTKRLKERVLINYAK